MGAFLIAIVRISLIRAKLAEILEVVHEHVTQIPNFFFLFPRRFTEFTKRDYPYTFHPSYPPP